MLTCSNLRSITVTAFVVVALALHLENAEALCVVNEHANYSASNGRPSESFGFSVSLSHAVAVVGAVRADDNGPRAGAAYVHRHDGSTWVQEARLIASDGAEHDLFGWSVAVAGDTAFVGATDDDHELSTGSVYVFRFNGQSWQEEAKLFASDETSGFGYSLSAFDDVVLIGAFGDNEVARVAGAAYVFRFDGARWQEEVKLLASDGASRDYFGRSVSLHSNVALIGANQCPEGKPGAAYVFRFDGTTWMEEAKLVPAAGSRYFGWRVSLSGGIALVGALRDGVFGHHRGAAYVFRFDGSSWVEEAKLGPDSPTDRIFSSSVAIAGETAIIGAVLPDWVGGPEIGSAYLFRFDGSTWREQAKFLASDGMTDDRFGLSVALSDNMALVGADWGGFGSTNPGSVYVLQGLDDCNWNGVLDVCDVANGTSADSNGNTVLDECESRIPATSTWGLIVLALLMLAGGKITFGSRNSAS